MKAVILTSAISLISLPGCVPYPIYKTLQPSASATVLDQMNQPLFQAEVMLISYAYPYGFEKNREMKETINDGTTSFTSSRQWRMESLMIHGSEVYFWNWCVRKEGYRTYLTTYRSSQDFQSNIIVHLEQGISSPCPKPFQF